MTAPHSRLLQVIDEAKSCRRCPTMHGEPKTLNELSGKSDARCLVIAEAPGKFGAEQTGIPLHGDRAGENFEVLTREAGIGRDLLFITNAVLCAPESSPGRGRRASVGEIRRCTHFVGQLLEVLDPGLVVTLGATALRSLHMIEAHEMTLKWSVGTPKRWNGRFVLPLYHPGARAMIQRPWAQQKQDYQTWKSLLT